MAQFIIRLVNHFATEIVSKGLANSPAFQRFAVRTHGKFQAARSIMEDPRQAQQALKDAEKAMREGFGPTTGASARSDSVADQFRRFKEALKEEVGRDLGSGSRVRRK